MPWSRFFQHRVGVPFCASWDQNLCKSVSVVKTEHVVHVREQPFEALEKRNILKFDGKPIPEEGFLNPETYAALLLNVLA
jgi:hypothetical protein